jgi:hypothetical protein
MKLSASPTAAWCARSMTAATAGSATAHSVETDFTGENVKSYPATVCARGRELFAICAANSAASIGARPCSAAKNSRPTWVRIRALSAAATEASTGSPIKALSAAIRWATSTRNGVASSMILNGAPNRMTSAKSCPVRSGPSSSCSRVSANGCNPHPNKARIWSAVTGSPTSRPSIPSMPEPTHTPGDSPRSV